MDLTIIYIGKPSFHREKTMDFTIIEKGFNHQTDRKTIQKIDQKSKAWAISNFAQEGSRGPTHSYMGNAYPLDIQLDIQLASTQSYPARWVMRWAARKNRICHDWRMAQHPRYIHCCWFHPIPYAYHPHIFPTYNMYPNYMGSPYLSHTFPVYCPWIIGYNYINIYIPYIFYIYIHR